MNRRAAFTLLEMVIVILILGIVAAIAVPRMANQTQTARENSGRQTLGILRNSIELYNAENAAYPAPNVSTPLSQILANYLNGPLPAPGVGYHPDNASVDTTTMTPSNSVVAGWLYEASTGNLKINGTAQYSNW